MQNEKWNFNIPDAPRLRYIPAVTFTDDGGKGVTEGRGRRGLGCRGYVGGDWGGSVRHYEPTGTGVLTTWPHPIVRSGITHPVIVSSSLMSLADSGHVSGGKEGAGNCENSENARLICKGNEVDIKHGYCLSLNLLFLIPLWCTASSVSSSLYYCWRKMNKYFLVNLLFYLNHTN